MYKKKQMVEPDAFDPTLILDNNDNEPDADLFAETQVIVRPSSKKADPFKMPMSKPKQNRKKLVVDEDDEDMGATLVLPSNKRNNDAEFDQTLVLPKKGGAGAEVDATLILGNSGINKRGKKQVVKEDDSDSEKDIFQPTLVLGQGKKKGKVNEEEDEFAATLILDNKKKAGKKQVPDFDQTLVLSRKNVDDEATQILPKRIKPPESEFAPTLLLLGKGEKKEDMYGETQILGPMGGGSAKKKQNLELILSESEEESPRFAEQKKIAKDSFDDDLLDQLDGGKKNDNKEEQKKAEEKRLQEEKKRAEDLRKKAAAEEEKREKARKEQEEQRKQIESKKKKEEEAKRKEQEVKAEQERKRREEAEGKKKQEEEEEKKAAAKKGKGKKAEVQQKKGRKEVFQDIGDVLDMVDEKQEAADLKQIQASSQRGKKRKHDEISDPKQEEPKEVKRVKRNEEVKEEEKKEVRHGRSQQKALRILVTGQAKDEKVKNMIKGLGGRVVEEIEEEYDLMLIGDKDKLIRNAKLLCTINRGCRIARTKWLQDSLAQKSFIDLQANPSPQYEIHDREFERKYKCQLKSLICSQRASALFRARVFYISKNVQGISPQMLGVLVRTAGGRVTQLMGEANVCVMDEKKDKKIVTPKGASTCGIEEIFESIMSQKVTF